MSNTVRLKINPDLQTIDVDNSKLKLKISSKENNGLSITDGKIVATKAEDGSPGSGSTMNTPGNAIGPIDATSSTSLRIIGFNSTVSRHKKYTGTDSWLKINDGPVMTKLSESSLVADGSIASYMISHANGVELNV